jgi:ubiquinol-cytochrome c reductase cytochrome b subunit
LGGFLDERFGLHKIREVLVDRGVSNSPGWWHTLGSINLSLLAVLGFTGVLLTLNYSPSVDYAYHSVYYIETVVPLGWVIRGLHHWAASFLVIGLILHLCHTFVTMAFRRPRELTWLSGVVLFLVVLGFSFTGYLLPWDQKAYWATVVGTSMAEQVPLIGTVLLTVVRGGLEVGAATLARFYGTHVTLLPSLLVIFVLVHLYLVVFHGMAGKRPDPTEERPVEPEVVATKSTPFWPDVIAKDSVAILVVLTALLWVALSVGAPLEAPADATDTTYIPRPEWYFLPLFQVLTYLPGWAEAAGTVAIPVLGILALVALPLWGPRLVVSRRAQWAMLGLGVLTLGVISWLGYEAVASSPPEIAVTDPRISRGKLHYEQLGCVNCHSVRGIGGVVGPDLTLIGLLRPDSVWLSEHLVDPEAFSPSTLMPAFPLASPQLADLVAYLRSLGNDLRYTEAAPPLFQSRCGICHALAGTQNAFGVDLTPIGRLRSVAYVHAYIEDPRSQNPDGVMPPGTGLSHEEVENIARYIVAQSLAAQGGRNGVRPPE